MRFQPFAPTFKLEYSQFDPNLQEVLIDLIDNQIKILNAEKAFETNLSDFSQKMFLEKIDSEVDDLVFLRKSLREEVSRINNDLKGKS